MPRAIVQFTCKRPGCDGVISETLWVSEPDYSAERMSDGDAIEDHDVTCPECETDYEIETVNGMGGFYANLDGETLTTALQYDPEPDDYEEFLLNYVPANDTVGAFEEARSELLALLATYQPMPASMLSRMIYSQMIATMEAYLSDKILKLATTHTVIKQRLAKSAGFVQGQTVNSARPSPRREQLQDRPAKRALPRSRKGREALQRCVQMRFLPAVRRHRKPPRGCGENTARLRAS